MAHELHGALPTLNPKFTGTAQEEGRPHFEGFYCYCCCFVYTEAHVFALFHEVTHLSKF